MNETLDLVYSRDHLEFATPSRLEGMSAEREAYVRRKYCKFMEYAGKKLKLCACVTAYSSSFESSIWQLCSAQTGPRAGAAQASR